MTVLPLRFRIRTDGSVLFANDAGDHFCSDEAFLKRYVYDHLTITDITFLKHTGCVTDGENDLFSNSFLRKLALRQAQPDSFSYVILVPTLRCNLNCTYCQVSRVSERASGFDWDEATTVAVLKFLDTIEGNTVKIEFQGGEPLLRIDLLERVYDFCVSRFMAAQFVVCTNLQEVGERELEFLERKYVNVSTSLDGDVATHERQRTKTGYLTERFVANLQRVIERVGTDHVSALPTIDYKAPPDFESLVNTYQRFGLRSIYLRPVNYQGFARKRVTHSRDGLERWNRLYLSFIDYLVERNATSHAPIEEYYFSLCLNRVLRAGVDGHVDLRNPSFMATDYVVVDYDGILYPTDEARMLARIGQIDLSIGDVTQGVVRAKTETLNEFALNNYHEDCIHCPYQPYCGTDLVDDISRYGRIDMPKHETWFCRRHLAIFDRIFDYLYSGDERVKHSLSAWAGLSGPNAIFDHCHHDTTAREMHA